MQGYFSYLPNINYVSRSTDRSSNDEFIQVKNIFRRAKIRDDMLNIVTGFDDYTIVGDGRPEQVAQKLYGDPRFDWVILTTNNIVHVRDEWPMGNQDFLTYLNTKYTSEQLSNIHHYETNEIRDDQGRLIVKAGIEVNANYRYYTPQGTLVPNASIPISNWEYEKAINDEKSKLVGDVLFSDIENRVSAISPVPGGVGPMTIACLLRNTTISCKNRLIN